MDHQYYLGREQGTLRLAQGIAGNREQAINNSIQKYVFIACKVVKYQIVTFYENPVKGERYAKDIGRHLPQEKKNLWISSKNADTRR
jgi:hypothetical protein